ncbi:acetyl-CoA carboxylase, carboxyltransferase subunit beta [Rhodospirillum rubrum]|uniref:acetyl-CoA carboxylase, carboxyltransferase subunit beta n=1 Tax=Rhodospirillum rubrum TaxID=1085 RepID=UPI001906435B|nr:acetyl-CoA carboxylase, carboxyltransferase subunit beta [Rhodospirillum rubrum]MBK1666284.1 acetyl-CoA carboxylase, carboxyltransferase subunit beta [Rhodospirillum rubrum]MBK1678464.1 acetyl-CoA carboxylase, carboxyltransferase subunit beta [Rhodospirillum rubrum]
MNWLTTYVRPKIRSLVGPREVPENLWRKCPACGHMIFHKELEKALQVCTHCGHHMRLPIKQRLELLFDDGAYTAIELPKPPLDPLRFKDIKRYSDRLKEAQAKTGEKDAIIVGHGKLMGQGVVVAAFNFDFMGGSMGMAVGEGLVAAAELALLQKVPLIAIPSSGGARMQEGILSLMQMARSTVAVDRVKEAGLPYIVLLTDPTTGGVTASFAMLGDIALAEPGAVIGFAGARVIETTIREKLPEGFQRSEYLLEHGMVDMVVPRSELKETLARLMALLMRRPPTAEVVPLSPDHRAAVVETPREAPKPKPRPPVEDLEAVARKVDDVDFDGADAPPPPAPKPAKP